MRLQSATRPNEVLSHGEREEETERTWQQAENKLAAAAASMKAGLREPEKETL